MIKKRPSHGKIVILTAVYFSANHEKHLLTFWFTKWSAPDGTGALDHSRNLGGTLYITPNGWCQQHAQLGFEHWVLDGPLDPKCLGFVIYLGLCIYQFKK